MLATGSGAARLLGMGTFVVLARALGVESFGVFTYAMSVALTVGVMVDMGQTTHLGRVVAADPEEGARSFGHVFLNTLVLTLLAALAAGLIAAAGGAGAVEIATLMLMMVWAGAIAVIDLLRSISRSLGRFGADSAANGGESALRLVAVLGAWGLGAGTIGFALAFVGEGVASAVGFTAWTGRTVALLPARFDLREMRRFFVTSIPLGLSALAFTGFYQLDQVFVRTLAGVNASGLYGAAARVVFAANMVGGLIATAVYPELVRRRDDPAAFRRHLVVALALTTALSTAVAVGLFVFAQPVLSIFGVSFGAGAGLLRVLAFIVALNGPLATGMYAATALHRERQVLVAAAVMLAVNVAANIVFVPVYGAYAAAWISLVGEAIMAVAMVAIAWPGRPAQTPAEAADA